MKSQEIMVKNLDFNISPQFRTGQVILFWEAEGGGEDSEHAGGEFVLR